MANVSINNITETWSSSGTTYTGIKYNVTDSASATGSKLIDLQVGGVSKFSVDKAGMTTGNFSGVLTGTINTSAAAYMAITNGPDHTPGIKLGWDMGIGWTGNWTTSAADLNLWREASGILAQRTGTNAQSYRIYLSYTDATNNSRFAINTTANYYRLASEIGTSTGSKKPIVTDIYQSTVDPTTTDIPDGTSTVWKNTTSGVVKLWANNGGTLIGVALA